MVDAAGSPLLPVASATLWDRLLSSLSLAAVGSFLVLYVLVPWGYKLGPALLLLLTLASAGFRFRRMGRRLDRDSRRLCALFLLYFGVLAMMLLMHGEDASEFDLISRFVAGALVLPYLLLYPIRAGALFFLVGLGGLLTGLHAGYQAIVLEPLRVSSFDNPVHYGIGALALALMAVAGLGWALAQRRRGLWLCWLLAAMTGGLTASILSGTRSGWLVLPLCVPVLLWAYRDRLPSLKWLIVGGLVLVSAMLLLVSQLDTVSDRAREAVDEIADYYQSGRNDSSVGLRLDMYRAGLDAFGQDPLIGVGPSGVESTTGRLVASGAVHPEVADFRHLHSQYIDSLARYGVIGLAAYLALLLVPLWLFLAKCRSPLLPVRALAVGGVLFMLLHGVSNLTQSMLERNIGVMMFVFWIVIVWSVLKTEERLCADAEVALVDRGD